MACETLVYHCKKETRTEYNTLLKKGIVEEAIYRFHAVGAVTQSTLVTGNLENWTQKGSHKNTLMITEHREKCKMFQYRREIQPMRMSKQKLHLSIKKVTLTVSRHLMK
jgi:hypothetical protein